MKLYLAPMEGITTYIFRNAFEKYYGGVDKYFTPFLTASHLKGRELRDVQVENNKVPALVPQILTNDSELFLKITRQLAALGYREVNLNLGCPSGTVTGKGRGAGFLDRVDELDRFLYNIYDGVNKINATNDEGHSEKIKISIKTRIGMEFLSEWDDILEIYKKYPISELIIHPRLRNEFYDGDVHMEEFLKALKAFNPQERDYGKSGGNNLNNNDLFSTNICYNGDITDKASFSMVESKTKFLFEERNQEKLYMLGRGALMNPGLPSALRRPESGLKSKSEFTDDNDYSLLSDIETFKHFINEIMESYIPEMSNDKQVVMKMKELWSYFAKGLGLERSQLKEIHKASRLAEYKSAVQMIMTQL